jgi:hypothetical protein
VGMLAVIAPELNTPAILNAIRQRHTYAVRGGEPIFLDFRVAGHVMGDAFTGAGPVRMTVRVKGTRPVFRIDLVRNNRYILSRQFDDAQLDREIEYQDLEKPPAFYYVRVFQKDGGYAWSSPVWVDVPKAAKTPAR